MRVKKSKTDNRFRGVVGGTWIIRHPRFFCAAHCGIIQSRFSDTRFGFRTVQSGCRQPRKFGAD